MKEITSSSPTVKPSVSSKRRIAFYLVAGLFVLLFTAMLTLMESSVEPGRGDHRGFPGAARTATRLAPGDDRPGRALRQEPLVSSFASRRDRSLRRGRWPSKPRADRREESSLLGRWWPQ